MPGQQVVQPHSAAHGTARDSDLVVPCERQQEKPRMFEGNAGGHMQLEVRLVGLAEQDARLQRSDAIPRLEPGFRTTQESVYDVETRQLRRLKIELAVPEEKGGLARRLAAMPGDEPRVMIHHIAAIQLANPIVGEARPLANGEGAGFVANQAQGEIEALAVPRITVIGHSHGRLPWCNSPGIGLKKNLTEITRCYI